MQPLRLRALLERHVNGASHTTDELGDRSRFIGRIVRVITRPLSSRTVPTVLDWWTANPTCFAVRFIESRSLV